METLERILAAHPFFADLDPQYLDLIAGCASNVRFEANSYLFREGQEANQFFLIREGWVGLEIYPPHHEPVIVETICEGEILGWSWLVAPYQWRFDGRALHRTRAIALDGKCLRTKCEQNHDLGYELLKRFSDILGQRLEAMRFRLLDVYAVR